MNVVKLELHKHQALKSRIMQMEPDIDNETLADTLEGATDLREIIFAVMRQALLDETWATALKDYIGGLGERLTRIQERANGRRAMVRDIMVEADLRKLVSPDMTLSLRPGSPSVLITDETRVPEAYWEPRQPRLDRAGLLAALKAGKAIPGAELSNGTTVLSVRVR